MAEKRHKRKERKKKERGKRRPTQREREAPGRYTFPLPTSDGRGVLSTSPSDSILLPPPSAFVDAPSFLRAAQSSSDAPLHRPKDKKGRVLTANLLRSLHDRLLTHNQSLRLSARILCRQTEMSVSKIPVRWGARGTGHTSTVSTAKSSSASVSSTKAASTSAAVATPETSSSASSC